MYKVSITDKITEKINLKEERFILASGLRGPSLWSLGPYLSEPETRLTIVGRACKDRDKDKIFPSKGSHVDCPLPPGPDFYRFQCLGSPVKDDPTDRFTHKCYQGPHGHLPQSPN